MPISDVIFEKSLKNNSVCYGGIIIARRLYQFIDINSEYTNKELEDICPCTADVISRKISKLLTKIIFVNQASLYLPRKLISFFPTWNYCIGKIKKVSIDAQEVELFFPIPGLDISGTIIFINLSKEEFNLLRTINNQKYHLIYYQVLDTPYQFDKVSNVIIRATAPSKIIPIKELGFNINDQEQPYLINKDSIYEEEA
jgi:hypothetical protein